MTTARGRAAAQSLIDVHRHLREQLAQVRELVASVAAQQVSPAQARTMLHGMASREQRWTMGAYCEAYCRLVAEHHFGEDVEIFPALRRGEPALGPVLDRLEGEHVEIHGLLDGIDTVLVRMVSGTAPESELVSAADALADRLLAHLDYEERELLEPMARVFG